METSPSPFEEEEYDDDDPQVCKLIMDDIRACKEKLVELYDVESRSVADIKPEKDIIVAVLDTGVRMDHLALKSKFAKPVQNKSNLWKNFLDKEASENEIPEDNTGHGTACAAIVLGDKIERHYDRSWITKDDADRLRSCTQHKDCHIVTFEGIAPFAKLAVGKVAGGKKGGKVAADKSGEKCALAEGIRWAVSIGANIISISRGRRKISEILSEAIYEALKKGVIIVCAAANEGKSNTSTIVYPAKLGNVICVGSHDFWHERCSHSAIGREIDVLGPGEDVWTADFRGIEDLVKQTGTSLAAPCVAGICALLLALADKIGVRERISSTPVMKMLLKSFATQPGFHDQTNGFGSLKPSKIFNLSQEHFEWKVDQICHSKSGSGQPASAFCLNVGPLLRFLYTWDVLLTNEPLDESRKTVIMEKAIELLSEAVKTEEIDAIDVSSIIKLGYFEAVTIFQLVSDLLKKIGKETLKTLYIGETFGTDKPSIQKRCLECGNKFPLFEEYEFGKVTLPRSELSSFFDSPPEGTLCQVPGPHGHIVEEPSTTEATIGLITQGPRPMTTTMESHAVTISGGQKWIANFKKIKEQNEKERKEKGQKEKEQKENEQKENEQKENEQKENEQEKVTIAVVHTASVTPEFVKWVKDSMECKLSEINSASIDRFLFLGKMNPGIFTSINDTELTLHISCNYVSNLPVYDTIAIPQARRQIINIPVGHENRIECETLAYNIRSLNRPRLAGNFATTKVAKGLKYATEMEPRKDKSVDILVIPCCFEKYCHSLFTSIAELSAKGTIVVVPAVQSGTHRLDQMSFPARYGDVLVIGNCDDKGQVSSESARGREIDFLFPADSPEIACVMAADVIAFVLSHVEHLFEEEGKKMRRAMSHNAVMRHILREYCSARPGNHDFSMGFGELDLSEFLHLSKQDLKVKIEKEAYLKKDGVQKETKSAEKKNAETEAVTRDSNLCSTMVEFDFKSWCEVNELTAPTVAVLRENGLESHKTLTKLKPDVVEAAFKELPLGQRLLLIGAAEELRQRDLETQPTRPDRTPSEQPTNEQFDTQEVLSKLGNMCRSSGDSTSRSADVMGPRHRESYDRQGGNDQVWICPVGNP